jgi:xylulose-5-phosphate/fructose-6-phosphate phosphoketolase
MGDMSHPGHVRLLEKWMKSYRPQELFDRTGRFLHELAVLAPTGERRMSANPHANGGLLLHDLRLPNFRDYALKVQKPGAVDGEATRVQGEFIRDVVRSNPDNFRVFSPDETNSNRWGAVFEVTSRCSTGEIIPGDDHVAPDGRVIYSKGLAPPQ